MVLEATAQEAWVFDGSHHSTFEQRIARADHLIFLDLPTWLRLWRVVSRTLSYRGKTRPDMAEGCPECFDYYIIVKWVGGYHWRTRPQDVALIRDLHAHVTSVHLTSRGAVAAYLANLKGMADRSGH